MLQQFLKLAEELEKDKKHNKVDSITEYLVNLSKAKSLKSAPKLKTDIPSKLLMLEKAGVDTEDFFEKLKTFDLTDRDIENINQKYEKNCQGKVVDKKDTDLYEYVAWMNKEKDIPEEELENKSKEYLDNLRETFLDFLTEVVVNDFKKEKKDMEVNPDNILDFYFGNRETYESQLDSYDLMIGQSEGIISDDNFKDELETEMDSGKPGPRIKRAE